MSIHPIHSASSARIGMQPIAPYMINCGRAALHMCKVSSNEMLMNLWPWMREGLLNIKRLAWSGNAFKPL